MPDGPSRELKVGIVGISLVAVTMLAYALFGRPPYSFYSLLRWTVALVCGVGSWTLLKMSKLFMPISMLLILAGGTHLFGRMRRSDWVLYNRGAAILLLALAIILIVDLLRHKET